jgi:hypothetical protein
VWAVVVLAIAIGIGVRAWILFHQPLNSDEAVAGIAARQILKGHFSAFYPGQPYGGAETYVVAGFFAVFGQSGVTIHLCTMTLSCVAALLTWRIGRHVLRNSALAALVGVAAFASPITGVFTSSTEYGFRSVTMVCGLACLLVVLRMLEGRVGLLSFAALGCLAGVGWWSSPEIVYLLLPAGLVLARVLALQYRAGIKALAARFGTLVVFFAVAALPWIWANAGDGFAGLKTSSFPGTNTPLDPGYVGRLRVFFHWTAPLELGLRLWGSGRWVVAGSSTALHWAIFVVAGLAVGTALVLCLGRGWRAAPLGVAVIAFPFLYALQPGTWYWQDGRYAVFLPPILYLAVAAGVEEGSRLVRGGRAHPAPGARRAQTTGAGAGAGVLGVAGALALSLVGFHQVTGLSPASFTRRWADPDAFARTLASDLHRAGVTTGYADYWVAYELDLSSGGRLALSPTPDDTPRVAAFERRAAAARPQVWIFVDPRRLLQVEPDFGATPAIAGPGGEPETTFLSRLEARGIGYRRVVVGVMDVVTTSVTLDPATVGAGLPGPLVARAGAS